MSLRIHVLPDVEDNTILVDQKCCTQNAHVLLAHHLLFGPNAARLGERVLGVGEEREMQAVFIRKFSVALRRVRTDAKDAGSGEVWQRPIDSASLGGASGGVIFGIKVDDRLAALEIVQGDVRSILVRQAEPGERHAVLEHPRIVAPAGTIRDVEARRRPDLLPLAVFLFALLVRLPGLGWGLKNDIRNASLHPDETPNFAYSRAVVPALGRFTPGFYSYGTLYLTTLSIASDVATGYTGGPKTKEGWSWTDSVKTDWDWVSRCILAGRIVSVVAGAATALVAFALARRVAGATAGVLAGALIALAPAHIVHSRFQTPDVLATALIGGALYFAVRALDPRDSKSRLSPATWCGLLAGLSASVKYPGILVLLALYAALALRKHLGWVRQAIVATAVAAGAFLLTTPGVLLETPQFWHDFTFELRHTATGQELFFTGTASGFVFHLANLAVGIGLVLTLMAIAGLSWATYRRHAWVFVLLAFLLPYYLLIGRAEVKYMRYTFPLYVGLAVGFGYAVSAAQRRGLWGKAAIAGAIVGLGGLPGGGVHDALPLTLGMMGEDPRDDAGRYLHATAQSVGLARDPWYWSPSIVPDGANPRSFWQSITNEVERSAAPKILNTLTPDGRVASFDPSIFKQRPDRVATSNFETEYPLALRDRKDLNADETIRVASACAWIDQLRRDYEPERTFANAERTYRIEDMDYVRPQVTVWKRRTP